MKNKLLHKLIELGISTNNSFKPYHPRTRDNPDVAVLKCEKSGVIALDQQLDNEEKFYKENKHYTILNHTVTKDGLINTVKLDDAQRRFEAYKELIAGKKLLDFGCGKGDFLNLAKNITASAAGVELTIENRKNLNEAGIRCYETIEQFPADEQFDVITLNHVYEHLSKPIEILNAIRPYLKDDGVLIIEVPHARDVLLATFELPAFKEFTFRSEHLLLHTRESLETFVKKSNFIVDKIVGFQRYPLSNHFYWMKDGKPGGNFVYEEFNDQDFHDAYEKILSDIDKTDTIIGYFRKA
ncbi:MAG: class I SAM-dependent methyltransferase [Micavibrio sp.]|nr:class I SAM-dependent methyltransferase [Micavibrio sp.]